MTSLWTAVTPAWTLRFQLLNTRSKLSTINAVRLGSASSPNSPTFRLGVTERLRNHASPFSVSVSNFRFTSGNSPNGGSKVDGTSDEAGRPPFLTILAGLLVFAALFWIASSIITVFLSLVAKLLFGK